MTSRGIAVLGSTGSVGVSTLDVLARHRDRFRVVALAARNSVDRLFEQCVQHRPQIAVLTESEGASELERRLAAARVRTEVRVGREALAAAASHPDVDFVMAAIVGAAGLDSTLAAARAGKRVLIANKESLVLAGRLLMDAAASHGATLIPIDSEHNAIFQCMPAGSTGGARPAGVRRILLTASGGPFLREPAGSLESVTPDEACAHPKWVMGRKISVDSATLMNKGLELIEACVLFNMAPHDVEVVVHPQSIVHSLVEFDDGSVLAQLGNPDMRTPIAHALGWPERLSSGVESLDLVRTGRLEFEPPDLGRFPCLAIARQAAELGGTAPAVVNAANEIAVGAFLERRLSFPGIARVIERVLGEHRVGAVRGLDSVIAADAWARERAEAALRPACGVRA